MKSFLKKLLSLLAVYFVCVVAIGYLLEALIWHNTNEKQYLLQADWHVFKNKNFETLFIGNSRVWVQLDIKKFNDETHSKTYAISQDGRDSRILWHKFLVYLKDNKNPRDVFLQFDPYVMTDFSNNTFYGKENYLSYIFLDRMGIDSLFEKQTGYSAAEKYVPLIRYIGYPDMLIQHITGKMFNAGIWSHPEFFSYGSSPQDIKWGSGDKVKSVWSKPLMMRTGFNTQYIDSFYNYCKTNGINLVLFYPPQSWISYKNIAPSIITKLNDYAAERKATYINFNKPVYNDSTLFYNHMHLNRNGSTIFTHDIIEWYKNEKQKRLPVP